MAELLEKGALIPGNTQQVRQQATNWMITVSHTVSNVAGMFEGHELPPGFSPHSAAAAAAAAGYLPSPFALMTSQSLPFMHQPGVAGIYSSPAGLMFAPALHHPAHHQAALAALHQQQQQQLNGLQEQEAVSMSSLLGKRGSPTANLTSPTQQETNDAKKARIQSSMRILKDEPVPEGYIRFRYVVSSLIVAYIPNMKYVRDEVMNSYDIFP